NRNSVFQLASASKLAFATYAMERIKSPNTDQLQKMQMSAGYGRFNPTLCPVMNSVASCFNAGKNSTLLKGEIGLFHYGDGHDNKLAIDLGMGDMGPRKLTEEIQSVLGEDTTFSYAFPDVVGGMQATPAGYGNFMRKLLSGKFVMSSYLGSYPVCTQPKTCSTSVRTPLNRAMHYSLNHWVEDDPQGDGAFSSIGLYGFYPWISADKQFYGILAMQGVPRIGVPLGLKCGGAIRKAWMTGQVVTK
ncbi:MAG TPA: hypothetical protein VFM46_17850, partial [Pseudomonadales bacterium]|nr:hypothetical protein [Pseudomonadales bacterium]